MHKIYGIKYMIWMIFHENSCLDSPSMSMFEYIQ